MLGTIGRKPYALLFRGIEKHYGFTISQLERRIWGRAAKRLFEDGYTVNDMLRALDDTPKNQWPSGTGLFERIRDRLYLQRRASRRTVRVDSGLVPVGALLRPR